MTKTIRFTMGLLILLATSTTGFSQDEKPPQSEPKFYHLDFAVKELEGGKVINSRNYSMTISTGRGAQNSSIRSSGRIPISSGSSSELATTQFTYVDVGVNIDCRGAKELPDRLALTVTSAIDSAAIPQKGSAALFRKTQWSSDVVVPLRKPTTIFLSDDAESKLQMQLELTATAIK